MSLKILDLECMFASIEQNTQECKMKCPLSHMLP